MVDLVELNLCVIGAGSGELAVAAGAARMIAPSPTQPLRLPPVQNCFPNAGRQASERQQTADVGVRDALLLRKSVN